MIVLVEGPDGSGKTTLCSYLVERGFKYIHLSKTKNVYNLYDELIVPEHRPLLKMLKEWLKNKK